MWSLEIKNLFSTPCRATSRAKLHSVFVESKQQVLLCAISPANIWQTQGEWTQCFFKHAVLELLAIVKTLGARKKIMNITVPKQEKQISLPPTPCQLQPWYFFFFSKIYHGKGMCLSLPDDLWFGEVCSSASFSTQRTKEFNCFKGMQNFSSYYRVLLNAHHTA